MLSHFFARYGYWVIFLGVMLENAGLPLPGETVLLFGGFLAFQGKVRMPAVVGAAIAGATLGDSLGFLIGRYGGTALVEGTVRRYGWLRARYDAAHQLFLRYGHWAVFTARFIAGLRVFSGILAGVLLMPYPRFLFFNFTGAVCWAFVIGGAGFMFGSSWERVASFLAQVDRAVLVIALGLAAAVTVLHWMRVRKRAPRRQAP